MASPDENPKRPIIDQIRAASKNSRSSDRDTQSQQDGDPISTRPADDNDERSDRAKTQEEENKKLIETIEKKKPNTKQREQVTSPEVNTKPAEHVNSVICTSNKADQDAADLKVAQEVRAANDAHRRCQDANRYEQRKKQGAVQTAIIADRAERELAQAIANRVYLVDPEIDKGYFEAVMFNIHVGLGYNEDTSNNITLPKGTTAENFAEEVFTEVYDYMQDVLLDDLTKTLGISKREAKGFVRLGNDLDSELKRIDKKNPEAVANAVQVTRENEIKYLEKNEGLTRKEAEKEVNPLINKQIDTQSVRNIDENLGDTEPNISNEDALKKTQGTAQTQKGLAKGLNIKGNQEDYNSFIDFAYKDDQIEEQISKDHTEKVVTETKPEMTGADRVSYTKRYLLRAAMIGSRLASGEITSYGEAIKGLNNDPTSKISQEELDKEVAADRDANKTLDKYNANEKHKPESRKSQENSPTTNKPTPDSKIDRSPDSTPANTKENQKPLHSEGLDTHRKEADKAVKRSEEQVEKVEKPSTPPPSAPPLETTPSAPPPPGV
ncbi:MAG TPA: hypothetical protein DCW33_01365 [Proteobacteria bacterium]|nr:hypothetical protein [Pseudomonadota bacterium]